MRSGCARRRTSACSSPRSPSAWRKMSPITCSSTGCGSAICTPSSSTRWVDKGAFTTRVAAAKPAKPAAAGFHRPTDAKERDALIQLLESQMQAEDEDLDFELAAVLRDQILELRADGDAVRSPHAPLGGRPQPVR